MTGKYRVLGMALALATLAGLAMASGADWFGG